MKADFYKIKEGKKETVTLPEEIFGVEWNPDLVHQTIVSMQSNKRNKVAHTKDRSDVRGGGKKPWRQKGIGRARHGSIRSPLWVGGGVTFGPRKEKNYKKKINKKVMLKALFSTLSKKNEDTEILFVDSCDFEKPNVKEAKSFIEALEKSSGVNILSKKKNSAVIFSPERSVNVWKSFNNFSNIKTEETRNINPLHLLEKKYIIFINPKDTIDFLQSKNEKIKSVKSEKTPSNEATSSNESISSNESRKETKKSAKKPEKTAKTKKTVKKETTSAKKTVTKTTKKASSAKAKDKKE